ncbi:hypothetical protein [Azospirillum sp. SYSU D00513]|uniref:hypothetical protein n=1 Tax=Azospirillum sp. SYSU D00513 TaxID=2812561 RepID=UPI001A971F7A|nr:hypothetical protein [Azospirillum sp. SYSU D00513]
MSRDGTGILVFGHTRLDHILLTLESLGRQGCLPRTEVWLDGHSAHQEWKPRVRAVRKAVADAYPEVRRTFYEGRVGIEKLMLDALSAASERYERIIVLEDDCFPTRDAITLFEEALGIAAADPASYSVYGHPFLVPAEGDTITRFQGWGWATSSEKLVALLPDLRRCFAMSEPEYLAFVERSLTPDVCARLDVTPGRDVINVLRSFFSWDSCTALLAAQRGLHHRRTRKRAVYNCGMGPDSSHFATSELLRNPPYNMISLHEAFDHW